MKEPATFPETLKKGGSSVKIYRTKTRDRTEFKVSYYDSAGKRKFQTFADYAKAKLEAKSTLERIASGNMASLVLRDRDRLIYQRAKQAISPLGMELDAAAIDYSKAKARLGNHSLSDAVEFYVATHLDIDSILVPDVVKELVKQKRKSEVSPVYLKDLEGRLGKFSETFSCPIKNVRRPDIENFLDSLNMSGRTRFNYSRLIFTLFNFAKSRGYYPKNMDPFEGIDCKHRDLSEIEVFSPEELSEILNMAKPEVIPFITIAAFAGLRHAELSRLEWNEINLEEDFIEIKKSKAKTRSRRLVPIQPNLHNWLILHQRKYGKVAAYANMTKQLLHVAKLVDTARKTGDPSSGFAWKHNALRHSFISYRLALIKDENRVALESGNSPQMIFQNYRQLVTDKAADQWFSITPPTNH